MHLAGFCQSTNLVCCGCIPKYLCVCLYKGLTWEGAIAKGEGVNGLHVAEVV